MASRRKWWMLSTLVVLIAARATDSLPVDVEDAAKPQEKAASKTQPAEGIEFPNTAFIPGDLTEQLDVDNFFSLWFVFLDDDVFTSDKEFTILAPANSAPMRPSPTMADKDRVRQLLLNHIVLGQAVRSSDLRKPLTLTTIGGNQIHFKNRKDGVTVNGVKILQKEVQVPHGVILVLEDFLFMKQYHGDAEASATQFSSIPMITSSDHDFPMIELGTHNLHDSEGQLHREPVKEEKIGSVLANRQQSDSNVTRPFYEELVEVLSFLRSGTSDFLRYLEQVNISAQFLPDDEYTAFIPMDDSFAQWYPIDWGFNPFVVDDFIQETILNHFVRGKHNQKSLLEGTVLTSLGGKKLKFSNPGGKLAVNGIRIFDGDTPVSRGNIHFIGDLLFVDSKVVSELNAKHRDVESAPLVISPWYSSQFLSHVYRELSARDQHPFSSILDYLNQTQPELHDDLSSHDQGLQLISYTFFVPENSAFVNLWPQDTADPFVIDSEFRRDVLLNHFVRQRIYDRDLVDGKILQMANNRTAKISRKGNVTMINDAVIREADVFIYNLGTVFIIDRVLFADGERINKVLAAHADDIPSFGVTSPAGSTRPVAGTDGTESVVVVDLVDELMAVTTSVLDTTEDVSTPMPSTSST